jgi:hypothetical protein
MTSVSQHLDKDKPDKDDIGQAVRNAQTFDDLVKILTQYNGFHDARVFQTLFRKFMEFAGRGFALSSEFPVWQRLFAAVVDDDGVKFIFATGLIVEFRRERGGKVRMRVHGAGGGE